PTESPRLPLAQVILHSPLAWFAEEAPRLPTRSRHHGHLRKLLVGVFGPVSATQCLHKSDDFTAFLKPCFDQRYVDKMGQKWVCCNEQVTPRRKDPKRPGCEGGEEMA